jgi:hypothetical protein
MCIIGWELSVFVEWSGVEFSFMLWEFFFKSFCAIFSRIKKVFFAESFGQFGSSKWLKKAQKEPQKLQKISTKS